MRIKTAVLVSGGGTNLQALIDAQQSGAVKSAGIELVISSSPDAYALERAKKAGIATAVVSPAAGRTAFEAGILCALEDKGIELIVLAGFMSILSADFTRRYENRIINVHPSLIPSFCGRGFYGIRVHEAALRRGVKLTGATVHFVNEIPDGGRIIIQKGVAVDENDTPQSLQRRVMEQAEWQILPAALEMVAAEIMEEKRNERI